SDLPITQVNGGSGVRGGFDVQDGKIVAIGEGVRLWLTEGDAIPEVADGAVVQYYTQGNAGGSGSYSDVFVLHSQSAYFYRQSDWAPDRKEAKDLDSVHGNEQGENNGLKDYIFVQAEPGMSYSHQFSTNNNAGVNVNTFNGVKVYYSGPNGSGSLLNQVSNQLEGVIYGDGTTPPLLADPEDTKIITIPGGAPAEYELDVEAIVQDLDGSEWLGNAVISGIPAGAQVSLSGASSGDLELEQTGGTVVLRWKDSVPQSDKQVLDVTLKITGVPSESEFGTISVTVDAHELTR